MSTCKIIGILLSALGVLSTAMATFDPGWIMLDASGEYKSIGLIYACENGQCHIYSGNVYIGLILMIIACVLQVAGVILSLFGQARNKRTLVIIAGGVQNFGGFYCLATALLLTIDPTLILGDQDDIIWSLLHYRVGYSYRLAWVGGVLAISAANVNIYIAKKNMNGLPPYIPM